jgi:hypothetical protein
MTMGNALATLVRNIRDLVETPLTQPLDTVHMFLIVGIVLVAIAAWRLIISHADQVLPLE